MNTTESCIAACNKLLRGELSAVETYEQALEKFSSSPESRILEQIMDDHEDSALILRDHLSDMGGTPDSDSGAWGSFAKAVEGTAKLFGESAALQALREGEEHGISEYEEALNDNEVMEEIKGAIRGTLLPRLLAHLEALDGLRPA
ncbi:MAG: DUF2383 domain-containing protein [Verrucomicrobiota bacterium]